MATAKRSGAAALPVRRGEKPWTGAELDKVRAELEAEVAELRTNIDQAESEIAERLGDAVGGAGDDQADAGAKTFQREYDLSLTQNARELLDLSQNALARIEDGSYGVCASCGQPIGKARLQAFPRATLCVGLQAARGAALTGPPEASGLPAPPGRRRLGLLLAVAAGVYAADVVSKVAIVATLPPPDKVRLLDGLLTLQVLRNSGAAFSIGTSMTIVFTLIAVGVIFFILRTSRRLRSLPWAVTLGLLLGGATGNLTDRLLRSPGLFRGDVVDWIQLPHWPVFNVADSAIVCGGVLAVLLAARGIRLDGTRDGNGVSGGPGAPPARQVADGRAHERGSAPGGQAHERGVPPAVRPTSRAGGPRGQAQERGSAAGDSRA